MNDAVNDAVGDATLTSPYEVSPEPPREIPPSVGRYQIRGVLGAGAMGVVYRAYDPDLDRAVAIKLVRDQRAIPSSHTRLLREAQAMARLHHPNVVPIFDVGQVEAAVFVAMPLLDGGTLRRWLAEAPRSCDAILDRFCAAGRGLAAAHAAGLVHRDFKPDNVLLGTGGEVQVADFGLARRADDETQPGLPADRLAPGLLTQSGVVLGTLPYMAPEQLRDRPIDARADQFSFCVALWEALYGARPFPDPPAGTERPLRARFEAIAAGPGPAPQRRDRPAWIALLLARGLAADPDQRWPDLQALLAAIDRRRARWRWPRWLAAILGTVTAAAAVVALAWPVPHVPPPPSRAPSALPPPAVRAIALRDPRAAEPPPVTAATAVTAGCPRGMVRVPAGSFALGAPDGVGDADEHPMHEVALPAFCIDRTEVTVAAYAACVTAGGCAPPRLTVNSLDYLPSDVDRRSKHCNRSDRPDHPINCVDWNEATAYCAWAGGRLPSEAEWEYAARGSDGRAYPWGNAPATPTRLNIDGALDGYETTAPVGSFPAGASPFGALDMAGNVWEWTADFYGPYPGSSARLRPPPSTTRSIRGGGWMNLEPSVARTTFRNWGLPVQRINTLGFRCAAEADGVWNRHP